MSVWQTYPVKWDIDPQVRPTVNDMLSLLNQALEMWNHADPYGDNYTLDQRVHALTAAFDDFFPDRIKNYEVTATLSRQIARENGLVIDGVHIFLKNTGETIESVDWQAHVDERIALRVNEEQQEIRPREVRFEGMLVNRALAGSLAREKARTLVQPLVEHFQMDQTTVAASLPRSKARL